MLLRSIFILMGCLLFSSCLNYGRNDSVSDSLQITLRPYTTKLPTLSSSVQVESTPAPSPTTEQLIYTVVAGDSLSGIALRYDVDLRALLAENPTVNPNAMSIGTKLKIPSSNNSDQKQTGTLAGLPTPVIQLNTKPDCYRMATDSWICFLLIKNDQTRPIENVTGVLRLSNSAISIPATCPLDIIPSGATLPLIALINLSVNNLDTISGNLTSAIPVNPSDMRYGTTEILNKVITLSEDLRSVNINGKILLAEGGTVRILAYAVDDQNHVLGYRLWDAPAAKAAGESQTFSINLFSLGDEIIEVNLVAQARLD